MSNRQDQEREQRLQPERIQYAKQSLARLGFEITKETTTELQFRFNDNVVRFFPYSGWHTGKSIVDGRGLNNLLKQLNKQQ